MEFLVVDGQQRLTTLSLLLCAIRDHRARTEDPTHRDRINEQYLFMRLPTRGKAVYQALWLPLQNMLSSSELEQLFWLDLVQRDPRVKQTETYIAQQARLDRFTSETDIEEEIKRFARIGGLLKTLLNPAREPDPKVRLRLERLGVWGTTTVYPLLLHLLDRRDQGDASSDEIARAMLYVESFFVRRLSGIPEVLLVT